MRVLDARNISYTAVSYDSSAAFHGADEAAALLSVAPELVYKTLVVLRHDEQNARPMIVMIPSTAQLSLKRLASAIDAKRVRMATRREAEQLTGMQAGGISALALRTPNFDVLIDDSARGFDCVHVSAGVRGTDLELAVADLVAVTGARFVGAT